MLESSEATGRNAGRIGYMEQQPGNPGDESAGLEGEDTSPDFRAVEIQPGAPRPATILKVADELEARGGEILELFREVSSPAGSAVFPIHLRQGGREFFVEVETGGWEPRVVESVLERASILRSSEKSAAELRVLSAEAVPEEVEFLVSRAPAALLQLDLIGGAPDLPVEFAELFRTSAGRRWGTDLQYSPEYLPLVEELLDAAFDSHENRGVKPPVLDQLVQGLGCFLGEIIRRASPGGAWSESEGWGESIVLETEGFVLDPVGKARAFMTEGAGDSIAFYAEYVLGQIRGPES
jgi:hypothetical protein